MLHHFCTHIADCTCLTRTLSGMPSCEIACAHVLSDGKKGKKNLLYFLFPLRLCVASRRSMQHSTCANPVVCAARWDAKSFRWPTRVRSNAGVYNSRCITQNAPHCRIKLQSQKDLSLTSTCAIQVCVPPVRPNEHPSTWQSSLQRCDDARCCACHLAEPLLLSPC